MALDHQAIRGMGAVPTIPDVAREGRPELVGTLDKVGMSGIEVPVRLRNDDGLLFLAPAKAAVYVSLDDPSVRGIHMSRLFISLQTLLANEELNLGVIKRLLTTFVASHAGISRSAFVHLGFDLLVKRAALVSDNQSWRTYPVTVSGELRGDHFRFRLGATVAYSSTCPCSAALARQLIQDKFQQDFTASTLVGRDAVVAWLGEERSILATPHSQRSYAQIEVEVGDIERTPTLVELIDLIEGSLKTPVQAAVKREDEQEFARLNGANLMFCEDAGRRLKATLDSDTRLSDYRVEAVHVESLHPHDAVSVVVKGVPGGFRA